MKFHETPLKGAYTIELEKRGDDRGFFARFYCTGEFGAQGLLGSVAQINNSLTGRYCWMVEYLGTHLLVRKLQK